MKTDHIPFMSYVFIGITSLVLTYATIADTTGEVINPSPNAVTPPYESSGKSFFSVPDMSGSVEKIKSLVTGSESTQPVKNIPTNPSSANDSTADNSAANDSSSKSFFSVPDISGFVEKIKSTVMGAESTQTNTIPVTPEKLVVGTSTVGGKTKNKPRKSKGTKRKKNKK